MVTHIWSILCERISIDRETNLASYLTCIEEITVTQLPFANPLFSLGTLWKTDAPQKDVLKFRVMLISPEKSEKLLLESKDYIFEKERHRANIILNGISFERDGTHIFRIQRKINKEWHTVSEIPIKIVVQAESKTT